MRKTTNKGYIGDGLFMARGPYPGAFTLTAEDGDKVTDTLVIDGSVLYGINEYYKNTPSKIVGCSCMRCGGFAKGGALDPDLMCTRCPAPETCERCEENPAVEGEEICQSCENSKDICCNCGENEFITDQGLCDRCQGDLDHASDKAD